MLACVYHAGQIDNKCTQMHHQVSKKHMIIKNIPWIEQKQHLVTNIPTSKINKTGNNKHGTVFINNSH